MVDHSKIIHQHDANDINLESHTLDSLIREEVETEVECQYPYIHLNLAQGHLKHSNKDEVIEG